MTAPSPNVPRIAFMGTPPFAAEILSGLAAARRGAGPAYHIAAVFCQPDRRSGRGRQFLAPPVKVVAERLGLTVHQPTKLRDGQAASLLRSLALDVVVVAAYGRILPRALLQLPRCGCVNVHASLLPRWRGASPIAHSILAGDVHTGVSIMQMDEGCDTGGVFATESLTIAPKDTAATLTQRLAHLGRDTLLATLPPILTGALMATPQPTQGVSHAPLLEKADGALLFNSAAAALARQVRALTPWPSAFCCYNERRIIVLDAHPAPADDTAYGTRAGEVLEACRAGVRVACGRGSLWLTVVKPAGSTQLHASAWIAGRGPKKGATLQQGILTA